MYLAIYSKQPTEVSDYDIDYADFLRDGETVSGAAATTSVIGDTVASSLLVDSVTASASAVRVRLSGGTDGRRYKVTATTTTSSGRIDEADFMVRVDEV